MSELSRDAQVIAHSLFGMGPMGRVTFLRPHILHPRTLASFEELESAGMVEEISSEMLPPGSKGWKGTKKIGNPWKDYAKPAQHESFPITTE